MSGSDVRGEAGALARLATLVSEMFSADELRRFVLSEVDGPSLCAELPEGASRLRMATDLVEMFHRRGALDGAFFARLIEERPRRARDIRAAAAHFVDVSRFQDPDPERAIGGPTRRVSLAVGGLAAMACCAGAGWIAWEFGAAPEAAALALAEEEPGPAARSILAPARVDQDVGAPAQIGAAESATGDAKGRRAASAPGRALTEETILEELRPQRDALRQCAASYNTTTGVPIARGQHPVRFSVEAQGRLSVEARGLLSSTACVLAAVDRLRSIRWQGGRGVVEIDLYKLVRL